MRSVKKINSDTSLAVIEKAIVGLSTEGGVLLSHYDKAGDLQKATIVFYGEMGKKTIEYYYKNGEIICCLQQEFYYNQPIYLKEFQVDKVEKNKYYFHLQRLIRWTGPNMVNNNINNEVAARVAKELVAEANAILKGAYGQ